MDSENKQEQGKQQTIQLGHISSSSQVRAVGISMRIYYSTYHLWAANHFADLAKQIEDEHSGPDTFNIGHRAYVTNAVFSAVAFMESAINELFQDAFDKHYSYIAGLDSDTKIELADFWSNKKND